MKHSKVKFYSFLLGIYVLIHYTYNIYHLFPYSHLYFNEIIIRKGDNGFRKSFEMDYWGTVYKELVQHVLNIDSAEEIKVRCHTEAGNRNVRALEDAEKRMILTNEDEDYFLTCFRYRPYGHEEVKGKKMIYKIVRKGSIVGAVYKMK